MERNENAGSKTKRKPYKRPRLQVYGDLRSITSAVGTASMNVDGGMPGSDKTH